MQWPGSPPIEGVGSTGLYQQFKVPVVECRFSVRAATSLEVGDGSDPDFHLTWDAARGVLELGDVVIGCSEPNFELEATDRVVGYERLRNWRIGRVQSSSPWESE